MIDAFAVLFYYDGMRWNFDKAFSLGKRLCVWFFDFIYSQSPQPSSERVVELSSSLLSTPLTFLSIV